MHKKRLLIVFLFTSVYCMTQSLNPGESAVCPVNEKEPVEHPPQQYQQPSFKKKMP